MVEEPIFYVYLLLDPRKLGKYTYPGVDVCFLFEPFYVGKGSDQRCYDHLWMVKNNKHCNRIITGKIKHIVDCKKEPIIVIIKNNMLEEDAFCLEEDTIYHIGRIDKNNGPLANLSDGGVGGTKGYVPTKQTRLKISLNSKKNWKRMSDAVKQKMAKDSSERMILNNPMKGKKHSLEYKKNMSKIVSGSNNGFFGKKHDKKTRLLMSQKAKGFKRRAKIYKFISPEGKETVVYGGFKPFLRQHRLGERIRRVIGKSETYKGWKVEAIN
jgi:hypothetical protein